MSASAAASHPTPTIVMIPRIKIFRSKLNPRKSFNEQRLAELVASLRAKGIKSPLQVRPGKKADTFELIAGERRHRASEVAGIDLLPCIVEDCTDDELVELALTENGQREDLTPMDEARAFQAAMKANPKHYTVAVVAGTVGKSESHVYRRLKLLELADDLQVALDEDRLSIAHAEKLMRLPAKLQKEACDDRGRGVVWSRSPLLQHNEKWVPSKEDLMPLAGLEKFIRERSHFNPAAEATRYLQPELIEQLQPIVADQVGEASTADDIEDNNAEAAEVLEQELSALVELSLDPMVRMRMRAGKADKVPLSPSKWKEVKSLDACAHARRGVITHGGAAKVLTVCIGKGKCTKHWPVAKKKAASKATKSTAQTPVRDSYAEQEKKRQAARAAWMQVVAEALPKLAEFTKGVQFSADLVRLVFKHQLEEVEEHFGVKLTPETAAHVMLLTCFSETDWRDSFLRDVKSIAPKFLPELNHIESQQKKAADDRARADAKAAKPATKAKAPGAKAAKKKEGRRG